MFVSHREHLGAVRVPAGSESFEALIYYCINKAKKSSANKNNNSRFKKRTGQFHPYITYWEKWTCYQPWHLNIVAERFACTGNSPIFFWKCKYLFCRCVSFALLSLDVSTSQTQQPHASQASEQREHLSSPSKKKWKSTLRKSPCLHLSSLLRWLHPREDRKSLLASMDPAPSNYGSLLWEPPKLTKTYPVGRIVFLSIRKNV